MNATTTTPLPTVEQIYNSAILPLAQAAAASRNHDSGAWPHGSETRTAWLADRLCLRLAEHAADQATDREPMQRVLAALVRADNASNGILFCPDDDAFYEANEAADALRHAVEDLIRNWGLDA